jgi:hypothetical protein
MSTQQYETAQLSGIKHFNLFLQCHIYCETILIHEQTENCKLSSIFESVDFNTLRPCVKVPGRVHRTAPKQVVAPAPMKCPVFWSESIYAGILYSISSQNDLCKRKETPHNGKLNSHASTIVWLHFRPIQATGHHRFTPCTATSS